MDFETLVTEYECVRTIQDLKAIRENFQRKPSVGYSIVREHMYSARRDGYIWTRSLPSGEEMRMEIHSNPSNSGYRRKTEWNIFETQTILFYFQGRPVAKFYIRNGEISLREIYKPDVLLLFRMV